MPLLAIGFISAGAISYEIMLMRLYSIVAWHHFASMFISIALLGYGVSGTFLAFTREWILRRFFFAWRLNAILFGVTAYAGFALSQRLGFNPLEITWEPQQLLLLGVTYMLLLVPFFFASNCVGLAFMRFGDRIGRIYGADLVGAGSGALGAILLMAMLPVEKGLAVVVAAAVAAAGCAVINSRTFVWGGAAVLIGIFLPLSWVEPHLSEYKGLRTALFAPGATIVAERHSPLAKLTVVDNSRLPFRIAPGLSLTSPHIPPEQLGLFIDGEGPVAITRFDGNLESVAYLDYTTAAAPYHAVTPTRALVLGTGDEVLLARYHEANHVDVVEANPFLAELLIEKLADYTGHVLSRPPVTFHVTETRAFVAASRDRYDLIQLPPSASSGGSVLTGLRETYAYTTEALAAYLDHLNEGGVLALTREVKNPPRDALKLMAASIDALRQHGVTDPGKNLILIRGWHTFTLLVKNGPFTSAEIERLKHFMKERSFDAGYYPGMPRSSANKYNLLDEPYFYDGAVALLSPVRERFMADYKFSLEPATDNRPYFNNFFKWRSLPEQVSLHGSSGYPLIERGYLIMLATLLQAAALGLILIVAPLPVLRQKSVRGVEDYRLRTVLYFSILGLSFLFIEIVFIQRFTLFLGHPMYAISVTLASFLIFAGAGAALSARMSQILANRSLPLVVTGIAVIALGYMVALPSALETWMPLSTPGKAAITTVIIAPLAFLMGMPAPLALASLSSAAPALVPWAWGVNGCASVVSPLIAILLSIHWGFDAVIVVAVALYICAAIVWRVPMTEQP